MSGDVMMMPSQSVSHEDTEDHQEMDTSNENTTYEMSPEEYAPQDEITSPHHGNSGYHSNEYADEFSKECEQEIEPMSEHEELFILASAGHIQSIRDYIDLGGIDKITYVSDKHQGETGTTLLHKIAQTRCTDILQALLSRGALVNVQNAMGETPLHIAVQQGHISTVEMMVSFGADVNIEDDQGRTPLQYCLSIDHEPSATDRTLTSVLLPTTDISICDFDGLSALHCLCYWDLWSQLEIALGLSRTARLKDNRGRTPLHYCFINPHLVALDAAFVLLKLDASIMAKDFDGNTPIHRLMVHPLSPSNREVSRFVRDFICAELKDPDGLSLLHISVAAGDSNVVKFMCQCNVDMSEPDPEGNTPLHSAVLRNQTDMVRALLQCSANTNAQDYQLQTPLHLAAIHCRITAAKLLLAEGADPDIGDERGRTALHCGVHSGSMEVVKLLLHSGCNVNALDKSDSLAIHYASAEDKLLMVELLIIKGSKVNISDVEGRTPLHLAVATGNSDILRILTLHGCSVNEYDKYGQTPLHMAAATGKSDAVQTLMNRGANEKLRDSEGRKAEQVALEMGSVRVMNVMKEHRDSMIMYSQENLDDIDAEPPPPAHPTSSLSRSRSNMVACVSNQMLDEIDECEDVLIEDEPKAEKAKANGSNGLATLTRFESDHLEKDRFSCCVIL